MDEIKTPTTEEEIVAALGLRPPQQDEVVADLIDDIAAAAKSFQNEETFLSEPDSQLFTMKLVGEKGPHIWGQEERLHLVEADSNDFYTKDLFYDDAEDNDTIVELLALLLRKKWQKLRENSALSKLSNGFTKLPGFNPPYTVSCFCSPKHDSHRKSPLLSDAWVGRLDESAIRGLKPDGNASVDGKETFNEVLTLYLSQTNDFTKTYGPRTLKPKSARTDERQGFCAACYKYEKLDEPLYFKQISFLTDKIWIYPFERNGELLFHILGSGNKSHFGEYRFWLGPGKGYIEDRFILVPPQRHPRFPKEEGATPQRPSFNGDLSLRSHAGLLSPSSNAATSNQTRFRAVNELEPSPALSLTPLSTPKDELDESAVLEGAGAGEKRSAPPTARSRRDSVQQPPSKRPRLSHDSATRATPPAHRPSAAAPSRPARPPEGIQIVLGVRLEGVPGASFVDITRCTGVDDFFASVAAELEDELPAGGAVIKSVLVTFGWDAAGERAVRIRRGNAVSFREMMRTVWEAPNEYWTEGRECRIMGAARM